MDYDQVRWIIQNELLKAPAYNTILVLISEVLTILDELAQIVL